MSIGGLLLGIIDAVIVAAIMVLIGAIIVWVAQIFEWPIPWNIQRLYLLIVLLIFIYAVIALLFGMPMVHILRGTG
jgi:Na+-translocating ferredoxin:NAD+ oxidoreductase RnfD subunit